MDQLLLADAVANGGQIEIKVEDIFYITFLILFMLPLVFWLTRVVRSSRSNIQKSLEQNEELLKYASRICERADSNERHLEAVEKKLDEIIEQLKRRPLS